MIPHATQPAAAAGRIASDPARCTLGRPARRRGVTLVEILLVVVIAATFAAIGAPRYLSSLHRYRCAAAAERVAADLALAQRTARVKGASQMVTFDLAREAYDLPGVPHPLRAGAPYAVVVADSPYRAALQAADFEGTSAVTFDAWGMPDRGGLVIVRSGDVERTVMVDAASGRAWVE